MCSCVKNYKSARSQFRTKSGDQWLEAARQQDRVGSALADVYRQVAVELHLFWGIAVVSIGPARGRNYQPFRQDIIANFNLTLPGSSPTRGVCRGGAVLEAVQTVWLESSPVHVTASVA